MFLILGKKVKFLSKKPFYFCSKEDTDESTPFALNRSPYEYSRAEKTQLSSPPSQGNKVYSHEYLVHTSVDQP